MSRSTKTKTRKDSSTYYDEMSDIHNPGNLRRSSRIRIQNSNKSIHSNLSTIENIATSSSNNSQSLISSSSSSFTSRSRGTRNSRELSNRHNSEQSRERISESSRNTVTSTTLSENYSTNESQDIASFSRALTSAAFSSAFQLPILLFAASRSHSSGHSTRGVGKEYLQSLPSICFTEKIKTLQSNNSSCSICLSEFSQGQEITCLPCGHYFHRGETLNAIESNSTSSSSSSSSSSTRKRKSEDISTSTAEKKYEEEEEEETTSCPEELICRGISHWLTKNNECPLCRHVLPMESQGTVVTRANGNMSEEVDLISQDFLRFLLFSNHLEHFMEFMINFSNQHDDSSSTDRGPADRGRSSEDD